jgi:hypothetical protein
MNRKKYIFLLRWFEWFSRLMSQDWNDMGPFVFRRQLRLPLVADARKYQTSLCIWEELRPCAPLWILPRRPPSLILLAISRWWEGSDEDGNAGRCGIWQIDADQRVQILDWMLLVSLYVCSTKDPGDLKLVASKRAAPLFPNSPQQPAAFPWIQIQRI